VQYYTDDPFGTDDTYMYVGPTGVAVAPSGYYKTLSGDTERQYRTGVGISGYGWLPTDTHEYECP
jgi:hypothetical protein